jgi:Rps23 Pro-64 3,4-dihydroxylase Tpa1-like proline 4-hydroxylase
MNFSKFKLQYNNAEPFPHIVVDNFFDSNLIKKVEKEISDFSQWDGEKKFYGSQSKRYCSSIEKIPQNSQELIRMMNGPVFLKILEDLTGIFNLIPDPYLEGGGYHSIGQGGFLKVHADFNWHKKLNLHRRINLLLYLNTNWQDEWSGHLELWRKDMTMCEKKISPISNRLVIFSTTDFSFHGHPDPLSCPADVRRKSIALYYYTADRPESEVVRGKSTQTDYRPRANEVFQKP